MQVIISLLNLQAQKAAKKKNKKALLEAQNRIKSMALIHETLYETKKHKINMQKYTEKLKSQHKDIKFEIDCRREFNLETSIPLAILINELLKIPQQKTHTDKKIEIKKYKKKIPINHNRQRNIHWGGSKTSLIKALTQQLDGILQTKNNQTIITFKELKYKKKRI
ncbi:MAG TPA: sensor histidine kinase [Methanobacteriales archaeon]|nr:sensor histidine kinase [Methanobacteriales archaeon]